MTNDNPFVKKAFFEHLTRQGFTAEHLAAYDEYFDFFLARLGPARVMDLEPESLYRVALLGVEQLDGEDIVEAYLELIQFFIEYWAERWENMQPDRA